MMIFARLLGPLFYLFLLGGYPLAFLLLAIGLACMYYRATSEYAGNASAIGAGVCLILGLSGVFAQQYLVLP